MISKERQDMLSDMWFTETSDDDWRDSLTAEEMDLVATWDDAYAGLWQACT